jgi:hypothetical protein
MKSALRAAFLAATLQAADVNQLTWITGCWSMQQGPLTIEERWTPPVGGQMMAVARTIRTAKVVAREFIVIDTEADGIYYSPRIGTKDAAVRFKLTTQTATEVIFENPTHDFPQRILYRKTADGLTARIDGMDKGKARAEDFPMKSVPCK